MFGVVRRIWFVVSAAGNVPVEVRVTKPLVLPEAMKEGAVTGTVQMKLTPAVSVQSAKLPPAGVAHVPSPRQNVVLDALVPLLRFVTGRLPVTPVERGRPVP